MEGGSGSISIQSVEWFPAQVAIPQHVLPFEIAQAPSVPHSISSYHKCLKILELRVAGIGECFRGEWGFFLYFQLKFRSPVMRQADIIGMF